MGRTLRNTQVAPVWRRNSAGQLVMADPDPDEYVTPPKGTRCRLQLSGISETFEMESTFKAGEMVEKVRVEFLIEKITGNAKFLEGKRFTGLYTWSIGPKSNLGRFIGALRGRPIEKNEDVTPDDYIGTSFVTTTTLSDDGKYAGVAIEAIEAGSVRLPPSAAAGANGVTTNGTADGAGAPDPFEHEEL